MKKNNKLYPALVSAGMLALPLISYAQTVGFIFGRLQELIRIGIALMFAVALLIFLWGLVQFIAKAENEEARKKGKALMTWGIIGLVVMVGVWALVQALVVYFGLNVNTPPNVPILPPLPTGTGT